MSISDMDRLMPYSKEFLKVKKSFLKEIYTHLSTLYYCILVNIDISMYI